MLDSTVPSVTPVPPVEQYQREQELYAQLDTLAANLSQSSLQFGWVAAELWSVVQEDFLEAAGGKEKKALGAFIDHVQERESTHIDARKTVADRLRIARIIPRDVYGAIVAGSNGSEPTFHQIRSCIVTKQGEVNDDLTNQMIDWCVANNWPTVADIRAHREELEPKTAKLDPASKHWASFCKMAQVIMREATPGGKRYEAAKQVMIVWTEELHASQPVGTPES